MTIQASITVLLVGIAILGFLLGLFYLKDRLQSPTLARLAHSELLMRFTVIAAALIVVGILLLFNKLVS
ncbi:MAG: hypothetical protein A3G25_18190 [Betaproteobacteria bacterium RIFCSPLOWO2_12_FULL_63_13]|nr:MAG: hypothetical protein A3H32_17160 [Betaproteobacteria bacterium RIFCSPLOWO2_02_FULL_63_19]OGA50038.1 MAG: hypothetical protein A3G25_18190 [Betaproteobacteria bacterium RIFCSPLOWO2_12_FULL_63_13]